MPHFQGTIRVDRPYYLSRIKELMENFPVVALLGPRQVGKTTLAKMFAEVNNLSASTHFYDLENPRDLQILQDPQIALENLAGLIVVDEIQRRPEIFPVLRYMVDHPKVDQSWLILGSASGELLHQTSESLAGRIAYLEINPFDYNETHEIDRLWLQGGFPKAYLSQTERSSFTWRQQYIKTFLEQDIPSLGIKIPAYNLFRFWMMLAHYHANIFNANELSRSLGVNAKSLRHYLDILVSTFMIRQLQPWWENISKRQVKSPKIYFRDSGLLHNLLDIQYKHDLLKHPKVGASWEGFAMEEIIRAHHAPASQCFFWSTHADAELDLLLMISGKRLGFEFKYQDAPKLTKSIRTAYQDLQLDKLFVIYPGDRDYSLAENIKVINLTNYLNMI